MRTIVQKFGGSSLATADLRRIAADHVLAARARGVAVVVVCSALGRAPEPYATDSLLALVDSAPAGPNRDLLLSCGELIAAAVFADVLRSRGARARAMTGAQAGIVTDDRHGEARVVRVRPDAVLEALLGGVVAVVAGFQGATEDGVVTTLGRGGSDLTAIALGAALDSEVVEIVTDTSGVLSADPRVVRTARPIATAGYDEMAELAAEGARVMHSGAAALAHETRTPYAVKGLRDNFGTTIDDDAAPDPEHPVTGLAARGPLTFVHVQGGRDGEPSVSSVALFAALAQRGVSIDMINVNAAGTFFAVDDDDAATTRAVLSEHGIPARVRDGCVAIAVVGSGMRGTPGVVHRVVRALRGAGVGIHHATDSKITISLLVSSADERAALEALHDEFALGRPGGAREVTREAMV